jgi:3-oxoacyl-[acyl-carrier-protein] synthase II
MPGRRVGLVHVGCLNDMYGLREFSAGRARRSRDFVRVMPSTPASVFMKENGFHGPSTLVSATCSSANNALLIAKLWLDAGLVDDALVITADLSLTPEVVAGFTNMGAAAVDVEPLEACRPFQEGSTGFPPGEASVAFVLSSHSDEPYGRVLGGAMTSDGYHPTGMDPSNREMIRCVTDALADAQVDPDEVRYFNAHGTGTSQCEAAERDLMEKVFVGVKVGV